LGPLEREGFAVDGATRAVYAVLIYTLGFVMWETPRVRQQPEEAYAAQWREGFALLPPGQIPRVAAALDTLGTLASATQFEFGLRALVAGLRSPDGAPPTGDGDEPPQPA
jgi:hypothetical protein